MCHKKPNCKPSSLKAAAGLAFASANLAPRSRLGWCPQLPQRPQRPAPSRPTREPRMTRPGFGSARHLRPPPPRARDGGAVFLLPSPFPKPLLLQRGYGFLLRHYRNDRRAIQSECDSSSKTRPLMVLRFLPAHTGVTSEERTAMKREGGAAHLCSDSLPESQQQNGNHAPNFSSHSSCRRRQRRRHDKALHAR